MSLQIVPSTDTSAVPVMYRGLRYELPDYLGGHGYTGGGADSSKAQAYLVHVLSPHGVIEPHYHDVDQYQVVVRGDGRIGRHELRPGSIHDVDHHTTYGPIVAGPGGLAYFTLRPFVAGGRYDMPQSRHLKKVRSGAAFTAQTDVELPVAAAEQHMVAATARGAEAFLLRTPPGGSIVDPLAGSDPRGGYYLVLAGSIHSGDTVLPPESCAFRDAAAPALTGHAGAEGAVVVFLAFPGGERS